MDELGQSMRLIEQRLKGQAPAPEDLQPLARAVANATAGASVPRDPLPQTPLSDSEKAQYQEVASLAKEMHAQQLRMYEERKRKRQSEEYQKEVRRRLQLEFERLSNTSAVDSASLYQLYSDLQVASSEFQLSIPSPEFVVVGMQSDGKSSFIEALLGFQFNVVKTNIGTRRPLVIQMINNKDRTQPYCRFQLEHALPSGDRFEESETLPQDLAEEIERRTNQETGTTNPNVVSDKPIVLRIEYASCANLTIYDCPGFRIGGNPQLKHDIQKMVLKMIRPEHRIIICLEQSTVEWANTVSRPIVRQIDPHMKRTVLINTKFDNRTKELRTRDDAIAYLQGEGLPANCSPFFISLPTQRNVRGDGYIELVQECHMEDHRALLSVGVQDQKVLHQVGFFNVKNHLEQLLYVLYHKELLPTSATLKTVVRNAMAEQQAVEAELAENDPDRQQAKVLALIRQFNQQLLRLLHGSGVGNPNQNGQTLQEEKLASGIGDWPDFDIEYPIQNQQHKVYGGAQYVRLLNEFEYVAHSVEFPATSINEVASALGTSHGHNMPSFESAVSDLIKIKARKAFLPLIDILLRRCSYVMKRLFHIIAHVMADGGTKSTQVLANQQSVLGRAVSDTFMAYVESLESRCRLKLEDDFATFTRIVDWTPVAQADPTEATVDGTNMSAREQTKARVMALMTRSLHPAAALKRQGRNIDDSIYQALQEASAEVFGGIRFFFVKYCTNTVNAHFLDPMFTEAGGHIEEKFRQLPSEELERLFSSRRTLLLGTSNPTFTTTQGYTYDLTAALERRKQLALQVQECNRLNTAFGKVLATLQSTDCSAQSAGSIVSDGPRLREE